MTSGCYPGVSRLYQHSSSRPAATFTGKKRGQWDSQLTTFEGKKWEQLPDLGVVAVPEICQKVLSLPGWYGELSDLRAQTCVSALST